MIFIKSYLKILKEQYRESVGIKISNDKYFIPIDIEDIGNYFSKEENPIQYYTFGVIYIESDYGQIIINIDEFDLIISLWWSVLAMMEDYLLKSKASLRYPNQDLLLEINKIDNGRVEVSKYYASKNVGYWQLNEKEFLDSVIQAAKEFYLISKNFAESDFKKEIEFVLEMGSNRKA